MIGMLLDSSIRITVLVASVAAILAGLRVRSGATRHAAWTVVLATMLLMPWLTRIAPTIPVRPAVAQFVFEALPDFDRLAPLPQGEGFSPANPYAVARPASSDGQPVALLQTPPRQWPSWSTVLLVGYSSVALILLCRLMLSWVVAARIRVRASALVLPGRLRVYVSPSVATPFTLGIFDPHIILPASWTEWDQATLGAVLAHECAHIRRRDPLVAFLAHLNRCLFWFHPLAWWLERTLAAHAEHACDDEAVRAIGERRRYAEVLLDMADAVRRSGGRVAWQGIGVDGNGMLGQRIDRILSGDLFRRISRARKIVIFASCAIAIVIVVACRRTAREAPPLRPDPKVAEQLARNKAQNEEWNAARDMTAQQVNELEAAVKKDPADLVALKKLRTFYQVSGQKIFGWNEMIARRRPHILRLIDEYPEHELAAWRVSASADPTTYAAAKTHWLAQSAKPGITAKALTNAAQFLEQDDPQLAEALLLKARTQDPEGRTLRYPFENATRPGYWSRRLGSFYGRAIVGPRSPKDGRPLQLLDADPYARGLLSRMMASDDATMLAVLGSELVRSSYFDPARGQLGRQFLERALRLDPSEPGARRMLLSVDEDARNLKRREMIRRKQAELAGGEIARKVSAGERLTEAESRTFTAFEYDAVSSLPEEDRFPALGGLAGGAYMGAEYLEYTAKDQVAAKASYERSKKAAQDALALAPKLRQHPGYSVAVYRATVALGTNALRDGDRATAVRYMLEAVNVPPSELFATGAGMDSLASRLVNYLLKAGERETVAQFLEGSAKLRTADTESLLKDAASVRAGVMPVSYQYAVARGE
jgi:hypothetical protein